MHLLFVCTGNICRSPMAERLAEAYAGDWGLSPVVVSSAGTRAAIGRSIHPHAVAVLEGLGARTSDFAARQLNARIASTADLILTMTLDQRDSVLGIVPHKLRSTFTLHEASLLVSHFGALNLSELDELRPNLGVGARGEVPDPIGRDAAMFASVGSQIATLLPPVIALVGRSL